MDKLQPPTPAEEITPAEPVEQISDDDAVSVLPDQIGRASCRERV